MNTAQEIKSCCTAAYSQDAIAVVLGESYHPGGLALTRRLAGRLGLRPGARVVDAACGPGATARLLAVVYGVEVDGVDLGEATIGRARALTAEAGLSQVVRFHLGDAERLPLPTEAFDALVCECALCTFPNKAAAAREFARVLRPGAKAGLTDVTVSGNRLPAELTTMAGWVACIADARSTAGYAAILTDAGLRVVHAEPHDAALTGMIDQIEARLRLLRMTAPDRLDTAGVDVEQVLAHTALARQAVADGVLGYSLLVAEKPAP